jgi:hypothetical protein
VNQTVVFLRLNRIPFGLFRVHRFHTGLARLYEVFSKCFLLIPVIEAVGAAAERVIEATKQ